MRDVLRRDSRSSKPDCRGPTSGCCLIGYFEGLDSERGIAWRTADSLALRGFLGLGLEGRCSIQLSYGRGQCERAIYH